MSDYSIFYNKFKYGFIPLLLATLASLAFDGSVVFLLFMQGVAPYYLIFPLVSLGLSVVFLLYVLASNLRMRYTIFIKWIYFIFNFILPISFFGIELFAFKHIFITTYAFILIIVSKFLFSALLVILTRKLFLDNSRLLHSKKPLYLSVWIISIASVLLAIGTFFNMSANGVYGQDDNKVVIYRIEKDNTLTAVGAIPDRSNKVIINDTFNGLKVKNIDASLLNQTDVKEVVLNSPAIEFVNVNELDINKELQIKVDKNAMDAIKNKFYDLKDKTTIALANAIIPDKLDDNELFINFTYTEESLNLVGDKRIKTWFGKKGTKFNLLDYALEDYVQHSNPLDVNDLEWNYLHNNKQILNVSNKEFNVSESINSYEIKFEQIYQLELKPSNDNVYNTINPKHQTLLSVISNVDKIFEDYPKREGFSLEWKDKDTTVNKVSEYLLNNNLTTIALDPEWSINDPKLNKLLNDYDLTYGDKFVGSVDITSAAAPIKLKYQILKDNKIIGNYSTSSLSIDKLKPLDSGKYTLKIISYANDSSLENVKEQQFNIDIAKKILNFTWTSDQNTTYSATNKEISVDYNHNDLVYGDDVKFVLSQDNTPLLTNTANILNVGTYNFSIELSTNTDLYEIKTNKTFNYTINKKDLIVNYDNESLIHVYDKKVYLPIVTNIEGFCKDEQGNMLHVISTEEDAVNKGNYVAFVTLNNDNYNITNPTTNFEIISRKLEVMWDELEFVYDGKPHNPTFNITGGLMEGDEALEALSAEKTEAGEYNVKVTIGNPNYFVNETDQEIDFIINKRPITVTADKVDVTYGDDVLLSYEASEKLIEGNTFSGNLAVDDNINAGIRPINLGTLSAGANYEIIYVSANLTIAKKEINVIANNKEVIYGEAKDLDFASVVLMYDDEFEGELQREEGEDVGAYNILQGTLKLSNNYILNYTSAEYVIVPKEIVIAWSNENVIYSGQNEISKFIPTYDDILGEEIDLAIDIDTMVDAKNYSVTVSFNHNETNYKLPTVITHEYNISPKVIDIIWNKDEYIYNGTNYVDELIPYYLDVEDNEIELKINIDDFTDAKTYQTIASFKNGETNYALPSVNTYNYIIKPKDVDVIWPEIDLIYTGSSQTNSLIPHYLDIDDNEIILNVKVNNSTSNINIINAGNYNLTAVFKNNETNYNLKNNITKGYTVNPKEITIDWKDVEVIYDGTNKLSSFIPSYKDVSNKDINLNLNVTSMINAGAYEVKAVFKNNETNYKLPDLVDHTYTIEPKEVVINWVNTSYSYTGEDLINNFLPSYKDVKNNSIKLGLDIDTMVDAGLYNVNAVFATQDTNYILPIDASHAYTVSVANNSLTQEFAISALTYGDEHIITAPISKFGTPTVKYYSDSAYENEIDEIDYKTPVLKYYVRVSVDATSNYNAFSKDYNFNITKRSITISWNSPVLMTYNGENHNSEIEASYRDIDENVVALNVSSSSTSVVEANIVDAKTYTLYASFKNGETNYALPTTISKQFSVSPKEVSVNWPLVELVYDGINHATEVIPSYKDINNNDVILNVNYSTIIDAGKYAITASFKNSETNYILSNESKNHNYEMLAKEVSVVWDELDLVYDGSNQISKIKPYYLDVNSSKISVSVNLTSILNAGSYNFVASLANNEKNYKLIDNEKAYEIKQYEISIIWPEVDLIYTGTNLVSQIRPSYLDVNSRSILLALNITVMTNAGTYNVVASFANNEKNYKLPADASHEYVVSKATNDFTTNYNIKNFIYGDNPTVTNAASKFGTVITKYYSDIELNDEISAPTNKMIPQTYYFKVSVEETSNYTGLENTGSFVVSKKEINILCDTKNLVYGTTPTFGEDGNIRPYFNDVNGTKTYLEIDEENNELVGIKDVGTYKIYVNLVSDLYVLPTKNYININVVQKEIEILWTKTTFEFDGTNHILEIKPYYLDINEDEINVDVVDKEIINAGEYSVSLDLSGLDSNYKLKGTNTDTTTVTVSKKEIEIDWGQDNFTYGDYVLSFVSKVVVSFTSNTFDAVDISYEDVNGNKIKLAFTDENGSKPANMTGFTSMVNVGSYVLVAVFDEDDASSSNYALPIDNTHIFVVNPKQVDVIWNEHNAHYVDAKDDKIELDVNEDELGYTAVFKNNETNYVLNPETVFVEKVEA